MGIEKKCLVRGVLLTKIGSVLVVLPIHGEVFMYSHGGINPFGK